MSKFINLHFNSEYSLLESSVTIDSYISFAIENNISTLSITDHNNMYGVDKFIALCKKNNIKPIAGVDLDVQNFRLILLAKNYLGFQELNRLTLLKSRREIFLEDINHSNLFIVDHPEYGYVKKNNAILEYDNFYFQSDNIKNDNNIIIRENRIIERNDNTTLSILYSIKNQKKLLFNYPGFINESNIDETIIKKTN